MRRVSIGLFVAGTTGRVAVLGVAWAGVTFLAQMLFLFAWATWRTNRRIDSYNDQVLISDNRMVTEYKRDETSPEKLAELQKYGNVETWSTDFPLPYVGDESILRDGRRVVVTGVTFDHTIGKSIIDVQEVA